MSTDSLSGSTSTTTSTQKQGWAYTPHTIIFFSSACVMVVELVAGRMIARHLGSSLYTWTSIIGVVLCGISIGNYIGGRLADRWKPESFLSWLFLLASFCCVLTLALNQILTSHPLTKFIWPLRVFTTVLVIFILPAIALGTISPVTSKMALERSSTVGTTLGAVSAWGTAGSIFGTMATGFWLIAALGSKGVVLFAALSLAILGFCMGPKRPMHMLWVAIVICIFIVSRGTSAFAVNYGQTLGWRDTPSELFAKDSDYQYVRVYADLSKQGGRAIRVLALDYLIHGYVDLSDPGHLEYDYELVYRDVARRFMNNRKTISAFFIGGGSYTFPRWVMHEWPGSSADVAEIDPVVLEANHAELGLPRDTPIKTIIGDARIVVDQLPDDRRYDLIFGDAFNDLSVPFHLTTLEFAQKIEKRLKPDGAYLLNVIDIYDSGLLLGSLTETLKQTFKHVYVFSTESKGVRKERDTFVIAASNSPIDTSDWQPGHKNSVHGAVLTEENLASLRKKCGGRLITDDDAPVENFLEPVVRNRE